MKIRTIADLGVLVKLRRQELQMTQAEFARLVNRPQSWVSEFERGEINNVYMSTVMEVLAYAGLDIDIFNPDARPKMETSGPAPDMGDIATDFGDEPEDSQGMKP